MTSGIMKKKISVKSRLVVLMLVCCFLPLSLIAISTSYYLTSDRMKNEMSQELQRLKFVDQNVISNLDQVIAESRDVTYDGTLMNLYSNYKSKTLSRQSLITQSYFYLRDHYSNLDEVKMAICWYREDPTGMSCSVYNSCSDASYSCIKKYWKKDHIAIRALAQNISTQVAFYQNDQRLYLVRNLYTRDYEYAATLVLLLNNEFYFQPYQALSEGASVTVQINTCTLPVSGELLTPEQVGITDTQNGAFGYKRTDQDFFMYHTSQRRDYHFVSMVHLPQSTIAQLLSGYGNLVVIMVLCTIPMLLILLFVYHRNVINPMQQLLDGAKRIAEGERGYQIEYEPKSREFAYLTDAFNSMSKKIEQQFKKISKEEIALRDARIKALQLHINPHFMNNTLEIINWEARFAGNEKISKMIEALGILMNAGMDRKNRRMIPLSEEMIYINAYLYITEERLGSRLTVINELPDDIMEYSVPRLILQPVVENAIEHGVVQRGQGTVMLYGYREGDYLYIEITNESVLSESDQKKIAHLLDVNYDSSQEPSGNLGISNVNQRLKMIYGEPCGLTIKQIDGEHVQSRLTLRVEKQ